jgi:GT2 family glycosyltransferase
LFQRIAEEVASSHEYSPDYNCDDFTRELVRRLREAGYEAERVEGYALWCQDGTSRCRHAWTKLTIYIESTTGEILTPEKYEEMYD